MVAGCKPKEIPTGNLVSKVEYPSESRTSRYAAGAGDDYKVLCPRHF
jgi:hypothetical protein